MDKNYEKTIREEVAKLIAAPSCCKSLKEAADKYINSIGSDQEKSSAKAFVAELEEDVTPIDGFIAFTSSDHGKQVFGEETAANMHKAAIEEKEKGGAWCICDACQAGGKLLEIKDAILA